jgi:hypothetical protein
MVKPKAPTSKNGEAPRDKCRESTSGNGGFLGNLLLETVASREPTPENLVFEVLAS